jgi:hypothetical protein
VELKPLSKDLASLGSTGLKLLDGQPAPAGFAAELTRMEKPNAEVSLAATRPIKALLKK